MAEIYQHFVDVPIVTRTYMVAALVTTAACALDLISPFALYLNIRMIFKKLQFWRVVTNFLFFGSKFNIEFLFHMFFLVRYSRLLEEGSFQRRSSDYFYMIFLGAVFLLMIGPFFSLPFLGSSLTFMIVYVWARRNPFAQMNFFGVLNFTAPYMPWVLLGFSLLFHGDALVDILGIVAGHLYYFLEDIYPRMIPSRRRLLKTPAFVHRLFGDVPLDRPQPAQPANPAGGGDQNQLPAVDVPQGEAQGMEADQQQQQHPHAE